MLVEALDDFGEFVGHGFVQDCGQGGAEGTAVDTAVAQGHALAGFGLSVAADAWGAFEEPPRMRSRRRSYVALLALYSSAWRPRSGAAISRRWRLAKPMGSRL